MVIIWEFVRLLKYSSFPLCTPWPALRIRCEKADLPTLEPYGSNEQKLEGIWNFKSCKRITC